jgi:carbamoylphosphate synthase large subunit
MSPWAAGLYSSDVAYLLPPYTDPAYLPALLDICQREKVDLLYPGNDGELKMLAANRSSFEKVGTKVVIGSEDLVEVVRDKRKSYEFFQKYGLPFVKTLTLQEFLASPDSFNWPVIIKPVSGSGSVGTEVLFELGQMEKYKKSDQAYIVQEYLLPVTWNCTRKQLTRQQLMPGGILRQEQEISIQFLVSHSGDIIGNFISTHTLKNGMPVHVTPLRNQQVTEVCTQMVQALIEIGLVGPINLQGRITSEGPIFYELNHRFTGITAVRARLGFNECIAILEDFCMSMPLDEVRAKLHIDYDLICTRYWTDKLVKRQKFEELMADKVLNRD